jgi:TolB protein
MLKVKVWLLPVLVVMLVMSSMAQAQRTITIIRGYEDPFRISVVPFLWQSDGSAPSEISEIIAANLERTGRFEALPASEMLGWPARAEALVFRDWRLLNQDYVVIGRAERIDAQNFEVVFELYDPFSERRMVGRALAGDADQWRQIAHRISDIIYEEITGVRGVFSTQIAYVAIEQLTNERRHSLYVADADGEGEQVLVQSPRPLMSPAWSPDGRQLAYVTFAPDASSEIHVVDLESGQSRALIQRQGSINSAPAFSPDGRRLAYTSSRDGAANIYVLDLGSGRSQQVTRHWAIDTEPNWIDNQNLVFTSGRSGRPQIYRIRIGADQAERLTFDGLYNARPRVSANGDRLVMVHNDGSGYHIATMDIQSRFMMVLTANPQDEAPSLAPNDSMVVYSSMHEGRSRLAWVSIDGMVENVMPSRFGNVREPAWSPFTR